MGYQLVHSPTLQATAKGTWRPAGIRPPPARTQQPRPTGEPRRPSAAERALLRAPGGATLLLAALLALLASVPKGPPEARRRWSLLAPWRWPPDTARRWALLALFFWVMGPGLPLTGRALGLHVTHTAGPLNRLLAGLPLASTLGNPTRLLAPFVLLAAVAATLLARRWRPAGPLLVAGALAETWLGLPDLALPASPAPAPPEVLGALHGPTIVFPSGDPPCWHPDVGPKEVLALAGEAGVPVAYDYGRGRVPADLDAQVLLTGRARGVIGRRALELAPDKPDPWTGFSDLLVLEDRLTAEERARLVSWLTEHARLRARAEGMSAWDLPTSSQGRPAAGG